MSSRELEGAQLDVPEVRPRLVWGRRARANGGRRRPRGRHGFYKYKATFSRGSYPLPTKPRLVGPKLEEFHVIPVNTFPPTGNAVVDEKRYRISQVYGLIARIRMLICARSDMGMTFGIYLADTRRYWKRHDHLLEFAEALRKKLLGEHQVEAPPVPVHFYHKF
ncbi:uncharacterized protein LOC100273209 [Zea mays]|uniref:Uncharacterized protein n=1 Tax=Zea mays TaxID=4577 RepID=B4FTK5_MAIZE|nr:uncharacterized protein LOC100273209 [Zea mays]ACF85448.1 unknown [Zea mays]|eukprot:NP_001141124.1 uncharacterized protein LOC100273209 [Zea mays]